MKPTPKKRQACGLVFWLLSLWLCGCGPASPASSEDAAPPRPDGAAVDGPRAPDAGREAVSPRDVAAELGRDGAAPDGPPPDSPATDAVPPPELGPADTRPPDAAVDQQTDRGAADGAPPDALGDSAPDGASDAGPPVDASPDALDAPDLPGDAPPAGDAGPSVDASFDALDAVDLAGDLAAGDADLSVDQTPRAARVVITEIHYHPADDGEALEYIEIHNAGPAAAWLDGWRLADAVDWPLPAGTALSAGGYLALCRDAAAVAAQYAAGPLVGDWGAERLGNGGETVTLLDAAGNVVDSVAYSDGAHPWGPDRWPPEADGAGPSLELFDPAHDNALAENWGYGRDGSPGRPNDPVATNAGAIVIDEIQYRPLREEWREEFDRVNAGRYLERDEDVYGEYVELFNRGPVSVDLSDWTLAAGPAFRFSSGTQLGPGAYLVVAADPAVLTLRHGAFAVTGPLGARLGSAGERLVLRDAAGVLIDTVAYDDAPPWPLAPDEAGAALECLDPHGDNANPANWRAAGVALPDAWQPGPPDATLAAHFDTAANPHDTVLPSGALASWSYLSFDGQPFSDPVSDHFANELPVPSVGWTSIGSGAPWVSLNLFGPGADGQAQGLKTNFVTGDVGGHSPLGVRFTARDGGRFLVRAAGYNGRIQGPPNDPWELGRPNELRLTGPGGAPLGAFIDAAQNNGREEAVTLSGSFDLLPDEAVTVWIEGGDWVGLRVEVWETADSGELDPLSPPVAGFVGRGTPGRPNSETASHVPPLVAALAHAPAPPGPADAVTVTAHVSSAVPLVSVVLETTQGIDDAVTSTPMADDGRHGDGAAGDGVYGAVLPPAPAGTLVHYRVRVSDAQGLTTVYPYDADPSPTQAYFVADGTTETGMTLFHLFIRPEDVARLDANPRTSDYVDCTLVVGDTVYPHIGMRYRGRGSRYHPKRPRKFQFNKSALFEGNRTYDLSFDRPFVSEVAFRVYDALGLPNLEHRLVRLHINGVFWGVYVGYESPTDRWVAKHDLHPATQVYKARSVETDGQAHNSDLFPNQLVTDLDFWGAYNKKTAPLEPPDHIRAFVTALDTLHDAALLDWLDGHVDLDRWLLRWAATVLMRIDDFPGHNHYHVLPGEPGGKWYWLGYDFDSLGRFGPMRLLYGDGEQGDDPNWQRNRLCALVSANPTLRRLYLLTMRQLLERLPPGTFDAEIDALAERVAPDLAAEQAGFNTMDVDPAGLEAALAEQQAQLTADLLAYNLPPASATPHIAPPGGYWLGPVSVTLAGEPGYDLYYTLDGSDPRLSSARVAYAGPFTLDQPATVRAAAARTGRPLTDGDWTDGAAALFVLP